MAARRDEARKIARFSCGKSELDVPFFHDPRRRFYKNIARHEQWLRIADPEWLQTVQSLKKLGSDLIEWQFGIDGDRGLEVFESQRSSRVIIQMRAKTFDLR